MAVDASVISVNFTEVADRVNQQIAGTTAAGFGGYTNWNNTAEASGTLGSLGDSDGNTTLASVTWSSSGVWGDGEANIDADLGIGDAQLARGYLDDGVPVSWNVTGHGFAEYDVVLYLSTDTPGDVYAPFNVNGTDYSTTGIKSQYTNPNWDDSNTIMVTGLTGDLTVTGLPRVGGDRGSIGGFQIVQIPEPATFGMMAMFGGALVFMRRKMRR